MSLQIVLFTGLIGSLLMFWGDMLLYYSREDYENEGVSDSIIRIMKKVSTKRLYAGGILGPVSAFLYCVGFYHLVLFAREGFEPLGWILFLVNSLGMICGGAYHSHFSHLGLIGRHESREAVDEVLRFLDVQRKVVFGILAAGFIGIAAMIVLGGSVLPRWMVLFSPLTLALLMPLVRRIPKGLHMIICGGWTNWISVIYYAFAIGCVMLR